MTWPEKSINIMRTSAEQAADEAIARVARPLSQEEKLEALILVGETALRLVYLTTDDIPFVFASGIDERAAGYVMRAAAREQFIAPTSEYRKSSEVSCHARPKRVWKSLIFNPG